MTPEQEKEIERLLEGCRNWEDDIVYAEHELETITEDLAWAKDKLAKCRADLIQAYSDAGVNPPDRILH